MDASQTVSYPSIETTKDPFADSFNNPNTSTRTYPRTFASGNQQGVQTLSDSRVFIDSGNGRIVITDDNGNQMVLGIPEGKTNIFGVSFTTPDGLNNLVLGLLPDGTMNLAIAKDGYNVSDAFTTTT
jgi:hypothetical protein